MNANEPQSLAGDVPESWAYVSVRDVGSVRLGRQKSPTQTGGNHSTPYLRAGNIAEDGLDLNDVFEMAFDPREREIYALREGDVVLAEASGSPRHVGRPAVWRQELPLCCFQNTVIRFRPHAVSAAYALAVFQHYVSSGVFSRVARGVGLLHLGAGRFGDLAFPLPPLAEQARIVAVLDARLAELREASAALESALAGTRQQDLEILDAAAAGRVGGKATGDRPARSSAPSDLAERHPVPDHWTWVDVQGAGTLTLGKSLGRGSRSGERLRRYLRVANVQEDDIQLDDLNEMFFGDQEIAKYSLRAGDVLLCDGQSPELVGRPAIYRGDLPELCFQNHLIRFRAAADVDPEFALVVFRHYLHAGEFRRLARGSTNIANLSKARLASMPFPKPPLEEQREIVAETRRKLNASSDQRAAIVASLAHAAEMSAELVRAAVGGRLVAQNTEDEAAARLLERVGPPPVANAPAAPATRRRKAVSRTGNGPTDKFDVISALRDTEPLGVRDLSLKAGVNLNDVTEIEGFYTQLRDMAGDTVEVVGIGEEALIRVVNDAPR
jgi:type I restriction enzyme S subunit